MAEDLRVFGHVGFFLASALRSATRVHQQHVFLQENHDMKFNDFILGAALLLLAGLPLDRSRAKRGRG